MKRFFLLDIYRIAIVFEVLLFHLAIHFGYTTSFKFADQFILSGAFAMTCFFMLSGALLSSLYSKKDFFAANEPVDFYKKRFAKIYPLYIVFLLLALFIRRGPVNWWIVPMQIVPLQAFFPQTFGQFMNGGVWFISDLLFAYLLFPFLNFLLERAKKNLRTAFLIVWGLIVYFTIVDAYTSKALYVSPAVRALEFMAGMICERWISRKDGTPPCVRYRYGTMFAVSLLLTFAAVGAAAGWWHFFNHQAYRNRYVYMDWFLLPLVFWTIYSGLKANNDSIPALFKSKIIVYLSNISYAFFLGQMLSLGFFLKHKEDFLAYAPQTKLVLAFIANLATAVFLYEVFQKRLLPRVLDKLTGKTK